MEQLEIRKLNPAIGAEIIGFDASAPIEDHDWKLLSRTFDECAMLAFRDIDLSVAKQHQIVEILHAKGNLAAAEGVDTENFSCVSNKEEDGGAPYGRLLFHDIPEDEVRAMTSLNAAKLYGFDLEMLQKIADRVGPSVAEVATAVASHELPDISFSHTVGEAVAAKRALAA